MPLFSVVVFTDEETVEVISSSWLSNSKSTCFWPSVISSKFKHFVTNHLPPQTGNVLWKEFNCRVLKSFDSYAHAREALIRAEETSNFEASTLENTPETKFIVERTRQKRKLGKKHKKPLMSSDDSVSSNHDSDDEGRIINLPKVPFFSIPSQSSAIPNSYVTTDVNNISTRALSEGTEVERNQGPLKLLPSHEHGNTSNLWTTSHNHRFGHHLTTLGLVNSERQLPHQSTTVYSTVNYSVASAYNLANSKQDYTHPSTPHLQLHTKTITFPSSKATSKEGHILQSNRNDFTYQSNHVTTNPDCSLNIHHPSTINSSDASDHCAITVSDLYAVVISLKEQVDNVFSGASDGETCIVIERLPRTAASKCTIFDI
ncbi:unnamed protein product [Orchesella dallaii]|uniref:Uncharacterized protein n=1 Tax=Orchesella dallaii TaxID=48710 RepID=A0ABP1R6Q3_9HEXA